MLELLCTKLGYNARRKLKTTTIFDLILSSYLAGDLINLGFRYTPVKSHYSEMTYTEQLDLWEALVPYLKMSRGSGVYIALNRAFKDLYSASMDDLIEGSADWYDISQKIEENYKNGLFNWSKAMFEKANIKYAVKPVHTPYIINIPDIEDREEYVAEKEIFLPILRIDDMMGWQCDASACSWSHMEKLLGISIKKLADIDDMVDRVFDFVQIHCYPYISEAAYMAKVYGNVYLDTAWLALQSPALLYNTLNEWIGFVPYCKICVSGDATSVEEAYGAAVMAREILARVLEEKINRNEIDRKLAPDMARAMLFENAARLYGDTCTHI